MKYVRTKDGRILLFGGTHNNGNVIIGKKQEADFGYCFDKKDISKQADSIEELCDCFIKIKRKGNFKQYILKFDHKDLPTLKEKAIKRKDDLVYGAIHVEGKGLIYAAKMNGKGEFELLC